jgi:Ca2+-binding EF-hand superfamily protein
MNGRQVVLSVLGLTAASVLLAADTPRKGGRAVPPAEPAITSPLGVWNGEAPDDEPSIPAKCLRLAQRIMKKYDRDGNGTLDAKEWPAGHGNLAEIDADHHGVVTVDELAAYLARYASLHPLRKADTAWQHLPQPPAGLFQPVTPAEDAHKATAAAPEAASADEGKTKAEGAAQRPGDAAKKYYVAPTALPPGLPNWFHELDADGDGQLTLGEFAPDGSAARRQAFQRYDENGDGVLTAEEVVRSGKGTNEAKASSSPAASATKSAASAAKK